MTLGTYGKGRSFDELAEIAQARLVRVLELESALRELQLLYSLAIEYERAHGDPGQADRMTEALARVGEAAVTGLAEPYICRACHHALVLHERDDEGWIVACCVEGCTCGHAAG